MSTHARADGAIPSLEELGLELRAVPSWRLFLSLSLPFLWCAAYFGFALLNCWPAAVFALIALSFVTYGSNSHDLVHNNLGLPRRVNDLLLSIMELLALRSGHAYQAAHLYHHARYPHADDIEGAAARRSLLGAIAEGFIFQIRIWLWALKNARHARAWIVGEGMVCLVLLAAAALSAPVTPVFWVYCVLMIMGSWIIPVVTSFLPHDPEADGVLFQTRAFRGVWFSIIALEHLYHLEHHLFPSVPHQNWPRLAKQLDPFLAKAGVKPIRL